MSVMNKLDAPLQLAGVHLQPYNDVVRPGQIWKVSKYFLRRWTPYMPASHIWLIIGARQESYFNGNRPWFTAYDQNLANAAGIHVRSFRRTAKKEIVEGGGPLSYFISKEGDPAYVTGQPVPKQEETRYQVRLDDPLTPADAEALAFWMRRHAPRQVTPGSVQDLLTAAREQSPRAFYANELTAQDASMPRLTVADVVAHVFADVAAATNWREAADRLHTHIVEPQICHLETQYLRRKWLPELGPGPLLLLVYLRSLCYHNAQTGETRNEVQILSGDLETLFQKSSVTLRAWFTQLDEALGDNHPHGPFVSVTESLKRADQKVATAYQLNLLTPLHPDDFETYRQLLDSIPPEMSDGVAKELSVTSIEGAERFGSPVDEGGAKNDSHVMKGQQRNVRHANGGEQSFVRGLGKKWQPYKYYQALFDALGITNSTELEEMTQQQQHAWKVENGEALKSFAAAAVGSLKGLLDHFSIYGKTRKKILDGLLDLDEVMAWYLYAEGEPGLDYPERYMMKQAATGQKPPEQFVQLARLSWEQWRVFAASRLISSGIAREVIDGLVKAPVFTIWCDMYGRVSPELMPFGVGDQLREFQSAPQTMGSDAAMQLPRNLLDHDTDSPSEDETLWQEVLNELSLQMSQATFDNWLKDSRVVSHHESLWIVGVNSVSARDWVENRLHGVIERTLSWVTASQAEVQFVIKGRS